LLSPATKYAITSVRGFGGRLKEGPNSSSSLSTPYNATKAKDTYLGTQKDTYCLEDQAPDENI